MKSLFIIGFCLMAGTAAKAEFFQPVTPRASTVVNVNVIRVHQQPTHSVFNGCMTGNCGSRYGMPNYGGFNQGWSGYNQGMGGFNGGFSSCGHRHHRGGRCAHRGRCCRKSRRPFSFSLAFGNSFGGMFGLNFARF